MQLLDILLFAVALYLGAWLIIGLIVGSAIIRKVLFSHTK